MKVKTYEPGWLTVKFVKSAIPFTKLALVPERKAPSGPYVMVAASTHGAPIPRV